jgi:hypothetical protein
MKLFLTKDPFKRIHIIMKIDNTTSRLYYNSNNLQRNGFFKNRSVLTKVEKNVNYFIYNFYFLNASFYLMSSRIVPRFQTREQNLKPF